MKIIEEMIDNGDIKVSEKVEEAKEIKGSEEKNSEKNQPLSKKINKNILIILTPPSQNEGVIGVMLIK